jgi:hypothetical protein
MINIPNKRILLNYANNGFYESQTKNSYCALMAGFNIVYQMRKENIDSHFYDSNKDILDCPRGAGYWIWKYYFQDKILSSMKEDDILMYADSGSNFIRHADPLFDAVRSDEKGIIAFMTADRPDYHMERKWTKREVFTHFGVDDLPLETQSTIKNTPQVQATFRIMRGTEFAKQFTKKCLEYACIKHLVDDTLSVPQEDGFMEHRHDQSVWSLMCKLNNITCMDDISQWGHRWREMHGTKDDWLFVDLHKTKK